MHLMGNVLTTLYVFCMYLCILGNAVSSFSFIFPDYGSNVIGAKLGKELKIVDVKWCINKEISFYNETSFQNLVIIIFKLKKKNVVEKIADFKRTKLN